MQEAAPGCSNILVVVDRSLSEAECVGLEELVNRRGAGAPVAIDFRVVTRATAVSPRRPPMELYVRVHADGSAESESRIAGERDLLAELSLAWSAGRSLISDDPQVLIGAVPDQWVVAYGRELVTRWQRLTDDEAQAA